MEKEWLVEIKTKPGHLPSDGGSTTVAYVEVLATSEESAQYEGIQQFKNQCKFEPVMRRKMKNRGVDSSMCCSGEAVALA